MISKGMISKEKYRKAGKRWHAIKNSPNPAKHPKITRKPYKTHHSKTYKAKKHIKKYAKNYSKSPQFRLGKALFGTAMKHPAVNVGKTVYKNTPKKLLKSGLFGVGGMALAKMK